MIESQLIDSVHFQCSRSCHPRSSVANELQGIKNYHERSKDSSVVGHSGCISYNVTMFQTGALLYVEGRGDFLTLH